MPFEGGNKYSTGRPTGSKNKRSIEFEKVLESKNFNVAETLIWCFEEAKAMYKDYNLKLKGGKIAPMQDNAPKYLKIAADIAKEIARYSYPKLKAIEQTGINPLEGMTPTQKLEVAKQLVARLEREINNGVCTHPSITLSTGSSITS